MRFDGRRLYVVYLLVLNFKLKMTKINYAKYGRKYKTEWEKELIFKGMYEHFTFIIYYIMHVLLHCILHFYRLA